MITDAWKMEISYKHIDSNHKLNKLIPVIKTVSRILEYVGDKFSKILEKLLDPYYFESVDGKINFLNVLANNILILYIGINDNYHCSVKYILLVETDYGWKYIYVVNNILNETTKEFFISPIEILENNSERLIFISEKSHFYKCYPNKYSCQTWNEKFDLKTYHKYERINDREAVYFSKRYQDDIRLSIINVIFVTDLTYTYRIISYVGDAIPPWISLHSSLRRVDTPVNSSPLPLEELMTLSPKEVSHIDFGQYVEICITGRNYEYWQFCSDINMQKSYVVQKISEYIFDKMKVQKSEYLLRVMYYIFLPFVKLIGIEKHLLSGEIDLIKNVMDILRTEHDRNDPEPLPLLMLRAVIYEYALLCFRRANIMELSV